ncbi:cytochrome P450 [Violaceomyces palustris]|uniref:Cytochrome P450 n=1 Tax=Violaceomyces palustris TaxID=1673888 RepID=A0ACD0P7K0_9BASI|nr:cytochrome P450 [Violaceomyces palustris]
MTLSRFLQIYLSSLPYLGWIRSIPTERQKIITQAYKKLEMVSLNLINRKKAEIQKEMQGLSKADFDEKEGHYDATGVARGKDLLHLMMRANMAEDVSEKEKLSDNELLGQITTLLLAGHETTSTQTTWTLHLLAEHPEIQRKLREEIHEHFGKGMERQIGYDEISSMKYLDCVVKEAMRFSSPVPTTIRVSSEDDVIPLSRSYHCHNDPSKTFDRIPISKGQEILIPIQAFNLSTDIWGPTAQQFDPTRWFEESLPSNARNSGLPLHLLTFIAGPRGCIGNRFAIAEFKALLVGLVGRFNFESVQGWEVEPKQTIVVRPRIVGQEHVGPQMPLRISRI